jgi:hypothetical protein
MPGAIDIEHARGRVIIMISVDGKRARISVTPERARRIAAELLAGLAAEADPPTATSIFGEILDIVRGKRDDKL